MNTIEESIRRNLVEFCAGVSGLSRLPLTRLPDVVGQLNEFSSEILMNLRGESYYSQALLEEIAAAFELAVQTISALNSTDSRIVHCKDRIAARTRVLHRRIQRQRMFDTKISVSEFLADVERECEPVVVERCRQLIAERKYGEKRDINDLNTLLEDVLSDVYQAELQEAAYWADQPFTSNP